MRTITASVHIRNDMLHNSAAMPYTMERLAHGVAKEMVEQYVDTVVREDLPMNETEFRLTLVVCTPEEIDAMGRGNAQIAQECDELRAKLDESREVAREIIRLVFAEGCEGEPEFEALHDRLRQIAENGG